MLRRKADYSEQGISSHANYHVSNRKLFVNKVKDMISLPTTVGVR